MPPPQLTPRSAAVANRLSGGSASPPSRTAALIPLAPGDISLDNQEILTEQEYTSSLSFIIKRDFFPHLDRLRAENDYLSALEDGDHVKINRALQRLIQIEDGEKQSARSKTPARSSETPRGTTPQTSRRTRQDPGETPLRGARGDRAWDETPAQPRSIRQGRAAYSHYPDTAATEANQVALDAYAPPAEGEPEASGFTPDLSLSLDAFQSLYTSEDNASFTQILDHANRIRRERYAWAYTAEEKANERKRKAVHAAQLEAAQGKRLAIAAADQAAKRTGDKERLLIQNPAAAASPSSSSGTDALNSSAAMIETISDQRTSIPSQSEGDADSIAPETRHDNRKNSVSTWRFKARNTLMYPPESLPALPSHHGHFAPSTQYRNTDFPLYADGGDDDESVGAPSTGKIDAAIRGSVAASSVTGETREDARCMGETPRVAGYGFVSPYASPAPSTPGDARSRMPKLKGLGKAANVDDAKGFVLPPTRRREELALKMAAGSASAASRLKGNETPYGTVRYTARGSASKSRERGRSSLAADLRTLSQRKKTRDDLTPAAKRLLDLTSRSGLTPTPNSRTSLSGPTTAVRREDNRLRREEAARLDRFRGQRWEATPSPAPHKKPEATK